MQLRDDNGQLRSRGPGRPKGARNRFTLLRQELLAAYHELNPETGREHLTQWARDNPTAFYTLVARLTATRNDTPGEPTATRRCCRRTRIYRARTPCPAVADSAVDAA